jgi:hypothetical protein
MLQPVEFVIGESADFMIVELKHVASIVVGATTRYSASLALFFVGNTRNFAALLRPQKCTL